MRLINQLKEFFFNDFYRLQATGKYGQGVCGIKSSNPRPINCTCKPTVCPQCGQNLKKNCYNAPNQSERYREYLEYLERLQGKSKKINDTNT